MHADESINFSEYKKSKFYMPLESWFGWQTFEKSNPFSPETLNHNILMSLTICAFHELKWEDKYEEKIQQVKNFFNNSMEEMGWDKKIISDDAAVIAVASIFLNAKTDNITEFLSSLKKHSKYFLGE